MKEKQIPNNPNNYDCKMFNYFISYAHINGFGNCEIKKETKISSFEDIKELRRLIEETQNFPENTVVILNFILLN